MLKLPEIFTYSLCLHIYKSQDQFLPPPALHNTRSTGNLAVPFERLRQTQQSSTYQATRAWNQLPLSIREIESLGSFKYHLKHHLLNKYIENSL